MRRSIFYCIICVVISGAIFVSCQANIGEEVEVNISKADRYIRSLLPLADIGDIYCGKSLTYSPYVIYVEVIPNQQTRPNVLYTVDLYEKGIKRSSSTVIWNNPEININKTKKVEFKASIAEGNAYATPKKGATLEDLVMGTSSKDLRGIFSVKIR